MIFEWSTEAFSDLDQLEAYWLPLDPELVDRFYQAVVGDLEFLVSMPGAGSPVDALPTRKWRIKPTPFLLFYRVIGERLIVTRVRHERENWRLPID